ncbi:MAG: four helix bundle protein [Chloroflexi bacterium]|nr:four helix bundle protein [Chloroflexota bacterium]
MDYAEWVRGLSPDVTGDTLWKIEAYRLAPFAGYLAWPDVTKLVKDRRTLELTGQLYDAVGSIGSHIAEGYSRSSGKDRVRFYEYGLGSAREGRHWYLQARPILGDAVVQHRVSLLTQIIRLLLTMIPDQRQITIREESVVYEIDLAHLLTDIPLPDDIAETVT